MVNMVLRVLRLPRAKMGSPHNIRELELLNSILFPSSAIPAASLCTPCSFSKGKGKVVQKRKTGTGTNCSSMRISALARVNRRDIDCSRSASICVGVQE